MISTTKPEWTVNMSLARARLMQWSAERHAIRCGKISNYVQRPGRPSKDTNRYDAALVRVIDFERELGKLPQETQTLLLLAYRECQPHRLIARFTSISERALDYKLPQALLALANVLDRADIL